MRFAGVGFGFVDSVKRFRLMQAPGGVTLHSRTKDAGLDGLPYAFELDKVGRFTCKQRLFTKAEQKEDYKIPGDSLLSQQVEKAVQIYSKWSSGRPFCQSTKSPGFSRKKCEAPDFSILKLEPCKEPTAKLNLALSPAPAEPVPIPTAQPEADNSNSVPQRTQDAVPSLQPLDKRYVACSAACKGQCLAIPTDTESKCGKRPMCCGPAGSFAESTVLQHNHVAFYFVRCAGNINHDFHQNFWPLFWWMTRLRNDDAALLVERNCDSKRHWGDDLLWSVARTQGWRIYNYSKGVRYCAHGQLHIMRSVGPCCDYSLKPKSFVHYGKGVIWAAVLGRSRLALDEHTKVLIYSRANANYRRIIEPKRLEPVFHPRLNVTVADDVPPTLLEQARFFSSFAVVLAPNGGWAPNVLFMASDACLIELHLYRRDSWAKDYGLGGEIGEILLITGDYHDPKKPILHRRGRVGGDDDILVTGGKDNLLNDVRRSMAKSHVCKQYLAT